MRVLIHSNAPWVPTGYGRQTAILLEQLRARGVETGVSAFYGLSGDALDTPDGPVFPAGQDGYGTDVLIGHARRFGADVVLTLMDFWKLAPIARELAEQPFVTAAWLPVDCTPLSAMDRQVLELSKAWPVAMSPFGLRTLTAAGFGDAGYLPHTVTDMIPLSDEERARARESMAVGPDTFVVGICSANRDAIRKAFPEQFEAFAIFHEKCPDSRLLVHTVPQGRGGLDLVALAHGMGIGEVTRFSDTYAQVSGAFDRSLLREWYGALDVLSCASMAEAFGVPILEAQACGTPVVVTDASAMPNVAAQVMPRVSGTGFWNPMHQAWWSRPDPRMIAKAYHSVAVRDRSKISLRYLASRHADLFTKTYGTHLDDLVRDLEKRCAA